MPILRFVGIPVAPGKEHLVPAIAEGLREGKAPGNPVFSGPIDQARSKGLTHALYVQFADRAEFEAYQPDPTHLDVAKNRVFPLFQEGKGPLVLDVEVPESVKPNPKGKITHVVAFAVKEGHFDDWAKGFERLKAGKAQGLPGNLLFGGRLLPDERTKPYNHVLVGEYESWDELKAYGPHPAHQAVVTENFRPIVSEPAVVLDFLVPN
ncbi:hypothetical protein M427DRAFT_133959 [Gonapodya prolifera JEL478]|uniref:Stress-response A/B barrel domain-containing protein n=1 Tax=Gonapodya prolifera (strain JEL478) TaxID=1344416 RepID=A0A139AJM3_GONPJ|nr:hypothetical protein M427DRAFT_133959 [Gonapodya prolifera JEL478]|eukprot:KXS16605.1 hypothetical protein M427DRAFT_133959 [Gonapodya prolifera JEL478]